MNHPILKGQHIDGFWFFFEVDNLKIAAHSTVWSKYKESIYVNDELVSEKMSLSGQGSHIFNKNDTDYQVDFKINNLMRGELTCELYRDDKLIAAESDAFYEKKIFKKSVLIPTAIAFLIGFIVSVTIVNFG
ncbi:MAG: hypothetical protein V2I33_07720 [Kangiellaceae bacterium]|jgi:hypothetical protein|nr:hypothetical protein [Kangiellaceae bacterium]